MAIRHRRRPALKARLAVAVLVLCAGVARAAALPQPGSSPRVGGDSNLETSLHEDEVLFGEEPHSPRELCDEPRRRGTSPCAEYVKHELEQHESLPRARVTEHPPRSSLAAGRDRGKHAGSARARHSLESRPAVHVGFGRPHSHSPSAAPGVPAMAASAPYASESWSARAMANDADKDVFDGKDVVLSDESSDEAADELTDEPSETARNHASQRPEYTVNLGSVPERDLSEYSLPSTYRDEVFGPPADRPFGSHGSPELVLSRMSYAPQPDRSGRHFMSKYGSSRRNLANSAPGPLGIRDERVRDDDSAAGADLPMGSVAGSQAIKIVRPPPSPRQWPPETH